MQDILYCTSYWEMLMWVKKRKMKERKGISHGRVFKSDPQILSVLKHWCNPRDPQKTKQNTKATMIRKVANIERKMWTKHHLLLVWVDEMFSRGYASFSVDFGGFVGNLILSREAPNCFGNQYGRCDFSSSINIYNYINGVPCTWLYIN